MNTIVFLQIYDVKMFIVSVANGYLEILNIRTVKLFSLWRDYGDNNDDVLYLIKI